MDDFTLSNLYSSRDEWCARLISILTPLIVEGIRSIFKESWKLALETDETSKYLMLFQNLLCNVHKWNASIIEEERKRIVERSACGYLEDLISCVHIIQLKTLTCIRVGNKQKKIDISIPKLDTFLHKVYIHTAREIYMNVYLFEMNITPLQTQKNNRELEILVQSCILKTIRESIPTESIIRAYLDEAVEQEEEVIIEPIAPSVDEDSNTAVGGFGLGAAAAVAANANDSSTGGEDDAIDIPDEIAPPEIVPSITNIDNNPVITRLEFNNVDSAYDHQGNEEKIEAPKTIERLEEISAARALQRKLEEAEDSDTDDEDAPLDKIKIHDEENVSLDDLLDLNGTGHVSDDDISLDFSEI
jgi:hypothetical protein